MTKEDVLEAVKERDVKFIRTQFTDTLGIIKSWAIPVEQLEEAFESGVMFDGSSIQGFTKIEESDMIVQVASGRFGVNIDYLERGAAIEIKIGQGAKPGIGGHLPGEKVSEEVSKARMNSIFLIP